MTSAKVKAPRAQSEVRQSLAQLSLSHRGVPDSAGMMFMSPQHPPSCWEEHPQLPQERAAGMVGWARGKAGEPGAPVRPGQARQQHRAGAGYPSPGCLIQPQAQCQGNSCLPGASRPAGERCPGCSANMGGSGECSGAWERKENSLGMGWRRSRARSHTPTQPWLPHPGMGLHSIACLTALPGEG